METRQPDRSQNDLSTAGEAGMSEPSSRPIDGRGRRAIASALLALALTSPGTELIAAPNVALSSDSVTDPPVVLQAHLHVLESRFNQFHGTASDADIENLFARVNAIWAQAGIRWNLVEITRGPLVGEERLIEVARGERSFSAELLVDLLPPRPQPNQTVWQVYLANDVTPLIGAPGVYLSAAPAVLVSEIDPAGLNDPGRILAHEFGHALKLDHRRCNRQGNLMSPACRARDRVRLLREQILTARVQARTGTPYVAEPRRR